MPWLLKGFIKNQHRKFYNQQTNQQSTKRKEGEVHIKSKSKKSSKKDDGLGDYIDFEDFTDAEDFMDDP